MSESDSSRENGSPPGQPRGVLTRAEFAAGFDRCWKTLWCVAAGVLGDRTQAEDVVQEAALIAMDKLEEFDPGTNLTAWLARIVRNVALNHARRRKLERSWAAAARQSASTTSPVRPDPAREIDDEQVLSALGTLSETARTCLLMRTVLDLSYKEIAATLEIPAGTAMSHVHRARASLRAALRSHTSLRTAPDAPGGEIGRGHPA